MLFLLAAATLLLPRPTTGAIAPLRQDSSCDPYIPRVLRSGPTFTPYTFAPLLSNREAIRGAQAALYPAQLKARRESGETIVWALVDRCGKVADVQVKASSGHELFDSAAVRIARLMRFQPALLGQLPVSVWVQLPIRFGEAPFPEPTPVPPDIRPESRSDALLRLPAPEGYVGPSLLNGGQLRTWLAAGSAEVGGRGGESVLLALHIDSEGRVSEARVATGSGSTRLDSLALHVVRRAVFIPAVDPNRRYCSLWTTLRLRFPPPPRE